MMRRTSHRIQFGVADPDSALRLFRRLGFTVDAARAAVPFGEAGQTLEFVEQIQSPGISGLTVDGVGIGAGASGMVFYVADTSPPVTVVKHPNGVCRVARVIAVASVPQTEAAKVVKQTGSALGMLDDGVDIDLGGLTLRIIGPGRARKVFPDYRHDTTREVAFIGLTFVADDMAIVEQHLEGGEIDILRTPNGHFYLPAKAALGVYVTFMATRHQG